MKSLLCRLLADRRAATAVEYGLIVSLIFLAALAAIVGFSATAIDIWTNVSDTVQAAS